MSPPQAPLQPSLPLAAVVVAEEEPVAAEEDVTVPAAKKTTDPERATTAVKRVTLHAIAPAMRPRATHGMPL